MGKDLFFMETCCFLISEMQVEIQQVFTLSQFSRIMLRNVKCRATFIVKISFNIYF